MPRLRPQSTLQKYAAKCQRENEAISQAMRMLLAASNMTHEKMAATLSTSKPTFEKWLRDPSSMRLSSYRLLVSLMESYDISIKETE